MPSSSTLCLRVIPASVSFKTGGSPWMLSAECVANLDSSQAVLWCVRPGDGHRCSTVRGHMTWLAPCPSLGDRLLSQLLAATLIMKWGYKADDADGPLPLTLAVIRIGFLVTSQLTVSSEVTIVSTLPGYGPSSPAALSCWWPCVGSSPYPL
jgi:hypothetical protein